MTLGRGKGGGAGYEGVRIVGGRSQGIGGKGPWGRRMNMGEVLYKGEGIIQNITLTCH